jgi:ATP-dependent Clp protease ATP-binding subunit ClpA
MHTGLEDRFYNYPKLAAFFGERAKGGVGLIVTGGISPNREGWLLPFGGTMNRITDAVNHRLVTHAVHKEGGKILLQILDEGELTDSAGKKISFTHSIIILTSNVSSEMYRHHGLGFGSSKEPDKRQTQDRIREKIKEHFGHALTSRLTAIVPFAPLDRAALSDIMQQQINNIINNLSASHGINITVSVQIIDSLLDQAQTKDHGARDIERIINTVVSDAIATVLSNKTSKKTYRLAQKGEYYQLI